MADDPANWSSAQKQAMATAQKDDQGKRHKVSESEMQTFISQNTDHSWSEIQALLGTVNSYLTPQRRLLLSLTGIDGIAIEIAASVSGALGLGLDFTPLGASFFFPFHTGVPDSTDPHPVDDAPHCYLFSSIGFDIGASAGAEGGVDMQVVFADHWGPTETITIESWSGTIISVDASAGISVEIGAEFDWTIYFSSISASDFEDDTWWDYADEAMQAAVPAYGLATSMWGSDSGWHGFGVGGGIKTGVEFEISGGVTLTTTLNGWLEKAFGRPDVRKAMMEAKDQELTEQGDWHYEPPPDPLSQFVGWVADNSSGVGEAMQQ